jgi:adenine-specific DNA-methyltransferase
MTKKQRLELTWIGKDVRPRLEPRILVEEPEHSRHAAHRVNKNDIFDNRLIHGDNLMALAAIRDEFSGQVQCVYIDPPFNTQQAFEHYDDGVEHSLWLSLMRDRLELLKQLLHPSGSIFIHIDDNELGYLIALADEVFGRPNRISVISFKQSSASGPKAVNPGLVTTTNFILYYAKNKEHWKSNKVYVPTGRDDRYSKVIDNYAAPFSEWRLVGVKDAFCQHHGKPWDELRCKYAEKLEQQIEEFVLGNAERVVRTARVAPKDVNEDARAALAKSMETQGRVFRSERTGKGDYYFLNGEQLLFYSGKTRIIDGVRTTAAVATNSWDDLLSNNLHKEGGVSFPNGKKPEALLKRILDLSTCPGDLVLDSFAGSGTTGAVAHKMGRRWIMVELRDHCETHVLPRMQRVILGTDDSGVTKATSWKGGGGFRFYHLAPSLLEKDRWGNWVIAQTYNSAMLAEAVCKLMGFSYAPSEQHYWLHGKSSEQDFIYVTTQSLTHDQLRAISEDVGHKRTLLICCKAFRSNNLDVFENLTVKKIPQSVLRKCEWGKDDYSLNVANLPMATKLAEPPTQVDLFGEENE